MLSQHAVTRQIFLFQSRGCEAAASAELSPHAHFVSAEICQISLQAGLYVYWNVLRGGGWGGGGDSSFMQHIARTDTMLFCQLPLWERAARFVMRPLRMRNPSTKNPRFRSEHMKAQVPTVGLFSPSSGGQTQSNRRMLSHQTSSTHWTPPT